MSWNSLWTTPSAVSKREKERKLVWDHFHQDRERRLKAERELAKERGALLRQERLAHREHCRDVMVAKIDRKGLTDEEAELEVLRNRVWKDHLKAKSRHITFIDWTDHSHLLASVDYVSLARAPVLKRIFDMDMARRRVFQRCQHCLLVQKLAFQNKQHLREKRAMKVFTSQHTIPCVRVHTNKINTEVLDLPTRKLRANPYPAALAPLKWVIQPPVDPPVEEWQTTPSEEDPHAVSHKSVGTKTDRVKLKASLVPKSIDSTMTDGVDKAKASHVPGRTDGVVDPQSLAKPEKKRVTRLCSKPDDLQHGAP